MPCRLGMRDEDVQLGPFTGADAGGSREVDAGVADRSGHIGKRPRCVLDIDDQVEGHVSVGAQPIPPAVPCVKEMVRRARVSRIRIQVAATCAAAVALSLAAAPASASRVLRVGTYRGIPGEFTDVQAAINAARPNDWILIAPGDYHEAATLKAPGAKGDDRAGAGVLIRKAGLWLRGMNRNTVWIDGTRPGSPRCSKAESAQDFGPKDSDGKPGGRNGILIYKAPGVIVENLSVCNFINGDQGGGNQLWWDGG